MYFGETFQSLKESSVGWTLYFLFKLLLYIKGGMYDYYIDDSLFVDSFDYRVCY